MNIYNNRFFELLKKRERQGQEKRHIREGLAISDNVQFEKYLMASTKVNFWVFIAVALFALWHIIGYLIRLVF